MLGIPLYLWRLLPGNPILLRVVATASKRYRDLIARCLYLGLLTGVVVLALATTGGGNELTLDVLTGTSERIFLQMSYLQLGLVALLAPIFTAGAITQEKDAQTYDILLATPLSNGQIVLGSLGSRLFFIVALLLSGIPIFSITKIFGGVAIGEVAVSFCIAAATACVTGALAVAIATFKVGTRRTIFGFYMVIVIYLIGGYLLDQIDVMHPRLLDVNTGKLSAERSNTSWLAGVHPFLALQTLFAGGRPPDPALLPPSLKRWPFEWYFGRPSTFFPSFMIALSAVLVLPSIVLLRRMAQSSTTWRTKLLGWLPFKSTQTGRRPRTVWRNPIAWREGRTKASSARASFVRYAFFTVGLGAAVTLAYFYAAEPKTPSNYIQSGSYDPANNTLNILGENQTYAVAVQKVTLDGRDVTPDALGGRYEVVTRDVQTINRARTITSIELATISGILPKQRVHQLLLGLVIVELAVILLVVTNAAASAVTREREDGTLDLLLTTPITSRYYLWGKLIGLIVFVLPLVLVPMLSVLVFVAVDSWKAAIGGGWTSEWLVLPEGVLLLPLTALVVVAFATIIGMQMSLRNRTTVRAVMSSLAIVAASVAVLGWCGFLANGNKLGVVATIIQSVSPLGVVAAVIYPQEFGGPAWTGGSSDLTELQARTALAVGTILASAAYAALVWTMYKSMVKNFDMTIRRQSR